MERRRREETVRGERWTMPEEKLARASVLAFFPFCNVRSFDRAARIYRTFLNVFHINIYIVIV